MQNLCFSKLEELVELFKIRSLESIEQAAKDAYSDSAETLNKLIESIKLEIDAAEQAKISKQMEKFDEDHMNYSVIFSRGHIGIPDESHAHISEFALGIKTASQVFVELSDSYKHGLLSYVAGDKNMNEQLTAYRHGFHYITHTKGHDGIRPDGKVYEVKNKKYSAKGKDNKTNGSDIVFDRLSHANLRKLEEGRPEIIFNVTDAHKVLFEMRIEMTDTLIEFYRGKIETFKNSKTSGCAIPFSVYKNSIIEVTHICDDIESYDIQKQVLEYLKTV